MLQSCVTGRIRCVNHKPLGIKAVSTEGKLILRLGVGGVDIAAKEYK